MTHARQVRWVDRLPAWFWLALPALALMPVWMWCAARLFDRSDDPLGIVALAALAVLVARDRAHFANSPRVGWLVLATLFAAGAILGNPSLPPLARGVLAALCISTVLMALRAPGQPMLALTGLALLALPLLSSLQFFIGYPLRVVTAEASRLILMLFGVATVRSGSALEIAGRLVMVDAPCAGIHMGWVAYFTACVAAAALHIPDGRFLRRIPYVGVAVLAGNIVRNTLLVIKEAQLVQWPDSTHEAIGMLAFAAVATLVLWHFTGIAGDPPSAWRMRVPLNLTLRDSKGTWARLFSLAVLTVLVLWPWIKPAHVVAADTRPAIEWPRELDGRQLHPLALSSVEQRFADRFPGVIGRFTDGKRSIVLRFIVAPTRMLHQATDCYRGLGYRVLSTVLEREPAPQTSTPPRLWRCFIAEKNGQRVRVCEHIVDAAGQTFTDTSAWYWAAAMGRSIGPWQAITKAQPLGSNRARLETGYRILR
jgi:exosortase/archaeosortase family protein